MKAIIKRIVERVSPKSADLYRAINNRRVFGWRFRSLHRKVRDCLYQHKQITVLRGAFQGLKYFSGTVWGPLTPKWLGSYEVELNHAVEEIVSRDYRAIIDVGCAEGYYAIGLACRMPTALIYAFDTDVISRHQARKLARLNGVAERVTIDRFCAFSDITRLADAQTLIICDIEGAERELLDPLACPCLQHLDVLVEVHEGDWTPSTLDLLKTRFTSTHSIKEIMAVGRQPWIEEALSDPRLAAAHNLLHEAVDEQRFNGRMWLWMKTMP